MDAMEGARVGSCGLELGGRAEKVRENKNGRAPRAFRLSFSRRARPSSNPWNDSRMLKNPGPARARSAGGSCCRSQMHTPRHIHWNGEEAWVPTLFLARFPVILVSS